MHGARVGSLLFLLAALASGPAIAAPATTRTVWSGTVTDRDAYSGRDSSGNPFTYAHDIRVQFRYVQQTDRQGRSRWVSRKVSWQATGTSRSAAQEQRCRGSRRVELGPATGDPDQITGAQRKLFDIPCEHEDFAIHFTFIDALPNRVDVPGVVGWKQLRQDCSYSEERGTRRYSVSVSPEFTAVMEIDPREYAGFVSAPGRKLHVSVRTQPALPVLFRFEMKADEVSRFPGYATNAYLDPAFFHRHGLQHLAGRYRDDHPDLVFDPEDFTEGWQPARIDRVETTEAKTDVSTVVTAMDYGAVGRLRAYAKFQCGGWQPVVVRAAGRDEELLSIPLDRNGNLIADGLEEQEPAFRGDPGADEDGAPTGDGVPGDGLTRFEEYRGFLITGGSCGVDSWGDEHRRTSPAQKDLFVYTAEPLLRSTLPHFAWATGLAVHPICARHYSGSSGNERVVNPTLQRAGMRNWRGRTVSQAYPQRGLHLVRERLGGPNGRSRQGPPRRVDKVKIDLDSMRRAYGAQFLVHLIRVTTHELGHAVGICHHGHGNIRGPVVIGGVSRCPPGSTAGTVGGRSACRIDFIAVQQGQNSGMQGCPIKYIQWNWYLPPGGTLRGPQTVEFQFRDRNGEVRRQRLPGYLSRDLQHYDKRADTPGLGRFSADPRGTGLNDRRRGRRNHAGDARQACAGHIRVNDLRGDPPGCPE